MLFAKTGICESERYNEMLLLEAFETARNRGTVSRSDKTLLRCSDRNALIAVNRHSRVLWGETLCGQLERLFYDDPEAASHIRKKMTGIHYARDVSNRCYPKPTTTKDVNKLPSAASWSWVICRIGRICRPRRTYSSVHCCRDGISRWVNDHFWPAERSTSW